MRRNRGFIQFVVALLLIFVAVAIYGVVDEARYGKSYQAVLVSDGVYRVEYMGQTYLFAHDDVRPTLLVWLIEVTSGDGRRFLELRTYRGGPIVHTLPVSLEVSG